MKDFDCMKQQWTTVITAKRKWYDLRWKELFRYRDLILMFVKRNFTVQYKQTVLGPLWFLITPLLSTGISTLVFGRIAGIETDGVPYALYYLCGFTLWSYFSTCVTLTADTFVKNSGLMGKVYFPRLCVPISNVIFSALNMLIVFALTICAMMIYSFDGALFRIGPGILLIPVLMLQTAVLGLGVGIIVSALTTKYRDLALLTGFGVNLWMYATPVVYPMSKTGGWLRTLIWINPVSPIIHNFHYAMLGAGDLEIPFWILSILLTLVLFFAGVILFRSVEKNFMDTI